MSGQLSLGLASAPQAAANPPLPDAAARRAIEHDLDTNQFVEAGAGAGLPPVFTVLDEVGSDLAFSQRWIDFLDGVLATEERARLVRLALLDSITFTGLGKPRGPEPWPPPAGREPSAPPGSEPSNRPPDPLAPADPTSPAIRDDARTRWTSTCPRGNGVATALPSVEPSTPCCRPPTSTREPTSPGWPARRPAPRVSWGERTSSSVWPTAPWPRPLSGSPPAGPPLA